MPIGSGLSAQLGLGMESTYGTYVAPTRFYEFNSESLTPDVRKLYSFARGSGRFQRASRVRTFVVGGNGDVELDVVTKGFGKIFEHMLGAMASSQVASTAEYKHTATPATNGLAGKSLTVQVGRPSTDGVVRPFNHLGGKIGGWTLSAAMDEILKLALTFDFKSVETSSALATASYPSGAAPLTFLDGTLTINGSSAATLKSVSLSGANAMDVERRSFGNVKREPIENGEFAITGEFASEFESLDAYNAWIAGTQQANLVVTFTGGTIPTTSNPYKLVLTLPVIEYTGSAPQVQGPEVLQQNLPFKALAPSSGNIITIDYHSDDTAA